MASKRNGNGISGQEFGELRSDVSNLTKNFDRFINFYKETAADEKKDRQKIADELADHNREGRDELRKHDKKVEERFGPLLELPGRVKAVEEIADDYVAKKNRVIGMVAGVSGGAGLGGGTLAHYLTKWFGGS